MNKFNVAVVFAIKKSHPLWCCYGSFPYTKNHMPQLFTYTNHYRRENLEYNGVIFLAGSYHFYVIHTHPVARMLASVFSAGRKGMIAAYHAQTERDWVLTYISSDNNLWYKVTERAFNQGVAVLARFSIGMNRFSRIYLRWVRRKKEAKALAASMGAHRRLGCQSMIGWLQDDVLDTILGFVVS